MGFNSAFKGLNLMGFAAVTYRHLTTAVIVCKVKTWAVIALHFPCSSPQTFL